MSLGAAETFGVALMMLWGTAGAVALGRAVAKSPAMREFAAGFRKMNLASKCALVAGLAGAVAIGGTICPECGDSTTILKSFPSASFFTETNNQQQNHEINVFAIVCRSISRLGPRFRAH